MQLDEGTSLNPVHIYLLARQGVHILEYHIQEALAEDQVYKFAYILGANDLLCGCNGRDSLSGGEGDDTLRGAITTTG